MASAAHGVDVVRVDGKDSLEVLHRGGVVLGALVKLRPIPEHFFAAVVHPGRLVASSEEGYRAEVEFTARILV